MWSGLTSVFRLICSHAGNRYQARHVFFLTFHFSGKGFVMNRKLVSLFVLALIFPGCAQATDQVFPVSKPTGEEPKVAMAPAEDIDSPPAGRVDLPRYPSISPDGKSIVFSWRGDLWKVPSTGGHARRLTSDPADEHLSAWSSDGKLLAFGSTRKGGRNIFLMNADGTGCSAGNQHRPVLHTHRIRDRRKRAGNGHVCRIPGGRQLSLSASVWMPG